MKISKVRRTYVLFISILSLFLFAGCDGGTGHWDNGDIPGNMIASITVTPATASIPISVPQQFSAIATYADGTSRDVTASAIWTSANTGVATINSTTGLAQGVAEGTSTITADYDGKSDSATLTVTGATLVSITVTPSTASSLPIGLPQNFVATGTYSDGTTRDITNIVVWSSDNNTVATVGETTGVAQGLTPGQANITASYGGLSGVALFTVTPATLISIAVTPTTATIQIGNSRALVATGTYSDGTTVDITDIATWASNNTLVATVLLTTGVTTGVSAGTATITATSGASAGSAIVTVPAATLTAIAVTPSTATVQIGNTRALVATGTYSDGTTVDITDIVTWASNNTSVATVAPSTGVATAISAGTATITATSGASAGSALVTVPAATLTAIAVTPATATVQIGNSRALVATGTYSDGTTVDITDIVTWTSNNTPVATVLLATGVTTGVAAGTATITATSGASAGSALVTVPAATLTAIAVTPATATVQIGNTRALVATGTYSDGTTVDITDIVTWASNNTPVATVLLTSGLATGVAAGTATITATSGASAGSALVTVPAATLTAIAVSPATATIQIGNTTALVATGTYSDGTTVDITDIVTWVSNNTPVATVLLSTGFTTGVAAGTATITATSGASSGSAIITVPAAILTAIAVAPATATVQIGNTRALVATGTYSDGTTVDITDIVTWTSNNTPVATVLLSTGFTTGVTAGTATITATSGAMFGSAIVTVPAATLTSIAVSPATATIQIGNSRALVATGTYSDGTTVNITDIVTWASNNTPVATVSSSTGVATGVAAGTATITATSGASSGSAMVTVPAATLTSIAVSPATATIQIGNSRALVATGIYSDGTTVDITDIVTWASNNTPVATVSSSTGVATGVAAGTATITATSGASAGSALVTVPAATLTAIAVTPATATVQIGNSRALVATGTYSDGTTVDITDIVTWTSNNTPVATVLLSTGVTTGVSAGTATITATSGASAGSAMVTVPAATLTSIAVSPATATIQIGNSRALVAIGIYSDGTTVDITDIVTWASNNTPVATVSSSTGVATGVAAGTATITATSGASSGSAIVTVPAATLTSIAVTPATATIQIGNTTALVATGTYSDGTTVDITDIVTWVSNNTPVATILLSTGFTTGVAAGTATITATSGASSGSAMVTVPAATLTAIAVSPATATIQIGNSRALVATGIYSDGTTVDITDIVTWASNNTTVATVSSSTGVATGVAAGTATITATSGASAGSAIVTVPAATLTSIAVSPATATIQIGNTRALVATGTYSDGTTVNITDIVTWFSSNTTVATVLLSTGVTTGVSAGTATITATSGAMFGSAIVTVPAATLTAIAVTPATATIQIGNTKTLVATGTYSDGTTVDITDIVTWASNNTTVATVLLATGVTTGVAAGTATITATSGASAGSAMVTVPAATLTAIAVTPATATIQIGNSRALVATGTYSDGTTVDITDIVTWASNNTTVATVSSSTGVATGEAAGTATLTATSGASAGSALITVPAATLTAIAVTPATTTIQIGNSSALVATGTYSDGTTVDITDIVTWASNNTTVATVLLTTGVTTAVAAGAASITATSGASAGSALVTVPAATLTAIAVTPATATIQIGNSRALVATGTYSDGTTVDITDIVTWTSSNTPVATVSSSTGVATGVAAGTATITATSGGSAGSAIVTVPAATLTSIAVTPATATIQIGNSRALVATGTYSDGTTVDITDIVTWASNNTSVATVAPSTGVATAVAAGTATITATSGASAGSALITVPAATLTSIAVSPATATIQIGNTRALVATGTYSDGTTVDITDIVTWASSNTPVATVSLATGVTTGVSAGTATITATSGASAGSALITVPAAILTAIAVTPATATIQIGNTRTLVATGAYSDGTTVDITNIVTWTSSNTPVATVLLSTGVTTGVAAGTATITATSGASAGSAIVTVPAATLTSIAVTPATATIQIGNSRTLVATGAYSDGTTVDITDIVTWTSSNTPVATVSSSTGVATAVAAGTATITATSGASAGSAIITVPAATLTAIAVAPATATVQIGNTRALVATGAYSDGTTVDITDIVTWASNNTPVATVSPSTGVATGVAAGTATITATSGASSGSALITVPAATLTFIAVTPATATIQIGNNRALVATGTYSDGTTVNITDIVTWTSSNTPVATVSSFTGITTAVAAGTATITATSGASSGSAIVTVPAATLTSIAVTPATATVQIGNSRTLVATGTYSDGTTVNITDIVTWTSSNTLVATVSSFTGITTAVAAGTATITATSGASSGSAIVTVPAATLTSIAVTPATATVQIDSTRALVATGTYSDGTTVNITDIVTWASNNTSVATVAPSTGVATAISAGTATITATSGASAGSALVTVPAATLTSIAVTPATATIQIGNTRALVATGTYSDGTTVDITDNVTWASNNTSVATVLLATGVTTGVAAGTATITATSGASAGSALVTVPAATLTAIAVTPATATIQIGNTRTLVATGTYSDGTTVDITDIVTWASNNTPVATVLLATGVTTGVSAGTATITATSGASAGSALVTVPAATLTAIAVSPATATIQIGNSRTLVATGTYSDGTTVDITDIVTWASSNTTVATVLLATGVTTGVSAGTATITATSGASAGSALITVPAATLTSIAVSPATATIQIGNTRTLVATGTYSDGTTVDITDIVTWASDNTPVATVSSSTGVATGVSAGTATITATSGANSGSALITVPAATLTAIAVTPATATIQIGNTRTLVATGTYSDGTTVDITDIVTWASSNTPVATVSFSTGVATAVSAGTAAITATSGASTGSAIVTVPAATLTSITVTPATATIQIGNSRTLVATGTYSDGTTVDITDSVTWASDNTPVATVLLTTGVTTAISAGTATITATSGASAGSALVTVPAATLTAIAVTPATATIQIGNTRTLVATGTYSDGTTVDMTDIVTWASDNTPVATVSSSTGVATGVSAGTATITATSGASAGSAIITVPAATLTAIAVSPATATIQIGNSRALVATGTYSDGTTVDITDIVTWASSNTPVATVSPSTGVTTGVSAGTATITATSGASAGSALITVPAATLTAIAVTPATATVQIGNTMALVATGTYSDGTTVDITNSVTWSSSNTPVATVSVSTGITTAVAAGTATITATSGASSGSALVTVPAATLTAIAVTPATASVQIGNTITFVATGTYSDGTTVDITNSVTWSSSNTPVATVSLSTGVTTAISAGTATITATSGASSGSALLTVPAATLTSIAVTPATATVQIGNTIEFVATGTYSDTTTVDITNSVTWSSNNTPVATVLLSTGVTTAISAGTATITATSGASSGSALLTVPAATLTAIAVTPATATVQIGNTIEFVATGTYSDTTTVDITNSVTWSSNNTPVATVLLSTGVTTGVSAGTAMITATSGANSGSALVTVPAATLTAITVTPDTATVQIGNTIALVATGTYSDTTTADITNSVTWASNNTSVATVLLSTGVTTAISAGTATITATSGANSGSALVTVPAATLTSIAITPATATVQIGDTIPLVATGTYSDATTVDITDIVTWSSNNTPVATVSPSTGVTTAVAAGTATITATSGASFGSAIVTVPAATLTSIAVSPATATVQIGNTRALVAIGTYSDATTVDITDTVSWTSSNTPVATVSPSTGVVTGVAAGTATITATSDALSGSALVTVPPATLTSIAVTPVTKSIALGTTQQFIATGTYSDLTTQDLTTSVTWSSSDGTIATIDNTVGSKGLATSQAIGGPITITATDPATTITGTATLTVTPATLSSIMVTPITRSIALGTTQQFLATGTYSDLTTQDLTTSVTWSSSDGTVATIDNVAGSKGLATSQAIGGPITITATDPATAKTGTATLQVTAATLSSITITPVDPSIALGINRQFTATGIYSDFTTQDLTTSVTWSSSNEVVATIDNAAGFKGLATSLSTGITTITATDPVTGVVDSTTLTVTAATLNSITVTPVTKSIALGTTQQFLATGTYSDLTTQDLTTSVTWSSSDGTVATIDNAAGSKGLATSLAIGGPITITATMPATAITGTATLQVTAATLSSITITPVDPSIALGINRQFTATGIYSDFTTQDLTTSVTWSSSNEVVATIDNAAGFKGLATSLSTGITTITATDPVTGVVDSTTLTVTAATLDSITVTPVTKSIALGTTQQFIATGTYSDFTTQNLTTSVTWSSADGTVATIDNVAGSKGLATSHDIGGPITITATDPVTAITGTAALTVTAATLDSITITPIDPSIALGTTQQFIATGAYSDLTTEDLTTSVTWSSSDGTVATIDNAAGFKGLATSLSTGITTITATDPVTGVVDTTTLTVTAAILTSITVTPTDAAISINGTQQFTATGIYSDSTTQDLTASVTWSSSDTTVAAIDNTAGSKGLATGLAIGGPITITATMPATLPLITGTAELTVTIAPDLGVATSFGGFGGGAGMTNQGTFTTIDGDIGTTGASTTMTGFDDSTGDVYTETPLNVGYVSGRIYTDIPPPTIFGPGGPFGGTAETKAIADAAALDALNAFNSISPASLPGGADVGDNLGGLILPPGLYLAQSPGPAYLLTGSDLTLDGQGDPNAVWVFQAPSSLTIGGPGDARSIILINDAQARNVYWYVGSSARIEDECNMVGTIIAGAGVTISTAGQAGLTTLDGRALGLGASVTMVNTIINVPAP